MYLFFPDGRHTLILYLLHGILVPTNRQVKTENGKKIHIKFSIKDSQQSFILWESNIAEIEESLRKLKSKNEPIQPLIMIIGSLDNPTQILVNFDDVKFKVFSVLQAVDVCFKIFHVFNLKYPDASYLVWTFIQNFFFKIATKYDKKNPILNWLENELSVE